MQTGDIMTLPVNTCLPKFTHECQSLNIPDNVKTIKTYIHVSFNKIETKKKPMSLLFIHLPIENTTHLLICKII